MRDVAHKAGLGRISSSTVHNVFRRSKVPRWIFVEEIVKALDGDPATFKALWEAAWQAENRIQVSRRQPAGQRPARPGPGRGRAECGAGPPSESGRTRFPPGTSISPAGWPSLIRCPANLLGRQSPHVQVICGMGGIGKTELATEYIYRNMDKYEIIWWIRAEHHDRVRDALVKLAQRLELRQAITDRAATVPSRPCSKHCSRRPGRAGCWSTTTRLSLLELAEVPARVSARRSHHHYLAQQNWPSSVIGDAIEVSPFTEDEAVSFLRQRVPGLDAGSARQQLSREEDARRAGEAGRLAAELGHLPIAVDHAAAYLAETSQTVDEYLTRFAHNAHLLLSEQPGVSEFPAPVSGTWAMSTTLLTQDAEHLFNLCAFFSPEPIAAELFLQDASDIDDPPGVAEFLLR